MVKYARCKIKNVAIKVADIYPLGFEYSHLWPSIEDHDVDHIEIVDRLPTNCIKMASSDPWCLKYCRECL